MPKIYIENRDYFQLKKIQENTKSPLIYWSRELSFAGSEGARCFFDFLPTDFDTNKKLGAEFSSLEQLLQSLHETKTLVCAPIFYQYLQLILAHHFRIYHCLKNIQTEFGIREFCFSATPGFWTKFVIEKSIESLGATVHFSSGLAEECFYLPIELAQVALHFTLDPPLWWQFYKLFLGRKKILLQGCENLTAEFRNLDSCHCGILRLKKSFAICSTIRKKIFSAVSYEFMQDVLPLLGKPDMAGAGNQFRNYSLVDKTFLKSLAWGLEQVMLLQKKMPLTILISRLRELLRIRQVKKILLPDDNTMTSRFITYVAHQEGINVCYLPHGIAADFVRWPLRGSPFFPDEYWLWSQAGQNEFYERGKRVQIIVHPRLKKVAQTSSVKIDNAGVGNCHKKYLLLATNSLHSLANSREDLIMENLFNVVEAFKKLNLPISQLEFKLHAVHKILKSKIERLKIIIHETFPQLNFIDDSLDSAICIQNSDLVICGLTTGIYEAILLGKPVIIYHPTTQDVETLKNFALPFAHDATSLMPQIQNPSTWQMPYHQALKDDLLSGRDFAAVLGDL